MLDHDFRNAEKEDDEAKASARKVPALEERLFKARTILIYGAIHQKLAETFSARLLALSADSDAPITIYINSQGGHVESGAPINEIGRANDWNPVTKAHLAYSLLLAPKK